MTMSSQSVVSWNPLILAWVYYEPSEILMPLIWFIFGTAALILKLLLNLSLWQLDFYQDLLFSAGEVGGVFTFACQILRSRCGCSKNRKSDVCSFCWFSDFSPPKPLT